jgi:adhesin/invasin
VMATARPGTFTAAFEGIMAGTATPVAVSIMGIKIGAKPAVTVKPGIASASTSSAAFEVSSLTSGSTEILTLVVKDAAGNAITGLTKAAIGLLLSGGRSTGTSGALSPTATPGTYTITFTGVLAGTASTLTVKINGVLLSTMPTVQVTPGPVNAGKSTVSFATPTVTSGKMETVAIMVKDAESNAVTGLNSDNFILALSGGTSTGSFGTVTENSTPGRYTVVFTGETAGTASFLSVEVLGVLLSMKPKVTVVA